MKLNQETEIVSMPLDYWLKLARYAIAVQAVKEKIEASRTPAAEEN